MNPKIPDNDHDLLVSLYTKFNSFEQNYEKDIRALNTNVSKFATRVSSSQLALDDRIRGVEGQTVECRTDMANMKDDIDDLQKRSNLWDGFIGAFSILGTILGVIFGNKTP